MHQFLRRHAPVKCPRIALFQDHHAAPFDSRIPGIDRHRHHVRKPHVRDEATPLVHLQNRFLAFFPFRNPHLCRRAFLFRRPQMVSAPSRRMPRESGAGSLPVSAVPPWTCNDPVARACRAHGWVPAPGCSPGCRSPPRHPPRTIRTPPGPTPCSSALPVPAIPGSRNAAVIPLSSKAPSNSAFASVHSCEFRAPLRHQPRHRPARHSRAPLAPASPDHSGPRTATGSGARHRQAKFAVSLGLGFPLVLA
jgi:hypothetical protein